MKFNVGEVVKVTTEDSVGFDGVIGVVAGWDLTAKVPGRRLVSHLHVVLIGRGSLKLRFNHGTLSESKGSVQLAPSYLLV